MITPNEQASSPLLAKLHDCACAVSYHNAAEGAQWRQEQAALAKAEAAFTEAKAACDAAGLTYNLSGYLL